MMKSQHRGMSIPRGKYKGQLLDDLDDETVHMVWAAWNSHTVSRNNPFFAVIVAENERRKGLKRAGMRPSDLDSARNLASQLGAGDVRALIRSCEERLSELESVRAADVKRHKRTDADWAETHYEWRCGDRVEWILNDVSMEGRETEECPFS